MVIFVESVIGCLLFSIIAGGMTYLKPLSMISNYPPEIQNRVRELGLISDEQKRRFERYVVWYSSLFML